MFKNRRFFNWTELAPYCFNTYISDNWTVIDICEKTEAGDTFYNQMAQATNAISNQLINGLAIKINDLIYNDAIDNFLGAVCSNFYPEVRYLSLNIFQILKAFECFTSMTSTKISIQF